jgi:photosynthetic reaction center cytochrome c subunit
MNTKRTLLLAVLAILSLSAFVARGVRAQGPGQTAPAAPKKAEEQFKNIQTLKGIPADQLIPTMQFITASLGVECDFCHVQGAFEKDDKKPKQTARKMIEMMYAINADNFDRRREVTCYSCHRGSEKPVAIPVVMAEEPKMGMAMPMNTDEETKEVSGPSGGQLLDKYLQAAGGAAAVDKVSSRVMKGTIDVGGKAIPIDIYSKDPDKRISLTHMPEGDSVTAFDGHDGWTGAAGRPMREMHGGDVDGASIDADLHLATHLKGMFTEVKTHGAEKVGESDAYVVVGQRDGKTPIRLYFDKQTGLLVRMVRFGETALGQMPVQIDYADYRAIDGVKIPYRWTLARPSGRFTIQVSDVQQNVAVDDAKFAKPPAPTPK